MRKAFLGLFLTTVSLAAQPIGVGIKAGLPFNDAFDVANSGTPRYATDSKLWIVGPQLELRLPAGLAIELDALYTKVNFSSIGSAAGSIGGSVVDGSSWEFPLMLKYKFGGANAGVAAVRPFVGAGASFRRLWDIGEITDFIAGQSNGGSDTAKGFVIGGGVEIRALFVRISPEIRYTRWGTENLLQGLGNVFSLNRNQAQFLVGFSF